MNGDVHRLRSLGCFFAMAPGCHPKGRRQRGLVEVLARGCSSPNWIDVLKIEGRSGAADYVDPKPEGDRQGRGETGCGFPVDSLQRQSLFAIWAEESGK